MPNPISVSHVTKRFGGKVVVNDISFDVGVAEFLVLVGPSGCGKTTTLRMLAGLESVTSGEIRFDGKVVNDIRPKDRDIAMVFQDYAIFPHLTVFENIAYGLRSRHTPGFVIKERVAEAAKTFRIDHLLDRKPRQLSGGERQRVALSRAMVRQAEVYLYDEPLSNLDAQLRHSAREDILMMHRHYTRPSIYVTHDQSEAMAMGNRIAVMRAGRIEQIGTGSELYEKPRNKFVAYFIGTPSINLFNITLKCNAVNSDIVDAVNGAFTVSLSPAMSNKVRKHVGKHVILGVRPEDFNTPRAANFSVDAGNTLQGLVNVIEPAATGCSVYMSTLEASPQEFTTTFKVRLPASYLGKEIPLVINRERVQLFDAETEQSLLYSYDSIHNSHDAITDSAASERKVS
jgi:multiple sugar transport system ATP-binding protein